MKHKKTYNNVNQPDILFASALKMTGYLRRYVLKEKYILKNLYESDKYEIISNLEYVSNAIIKRLYATFDSIDKEADQVEKEAYINSAKFFNPDTMDVPYGLEEAYDEGVNHYIIHNEMKTQFLNSTITWIFHLFEKDCIRIFETNDGDIKKSTLENIGVGVSLTSYWHTCNTELRLIANTIKHGKGNSSEKLKKIKPNFFKKDYIGELDDEITLTINDVEFYIKAMNGFWEELFRITIPKLNSELHT